MKICLLGQEVWTGWVHLYEWPPFVGEGPFYMAPWDDGATWGHQVGVFLLAFLKASRQLASWPIVTLQFGPISWSVRSCHSPVIGVRSLSPASLSRAGWHCHFTAYLGCALRIVGGGLLVQVSSPKFLSWPDILSPDLSWSGAVNQACCRQQRRRRLASCWGAPPLLLLTLVVTAHSWKGFPCMRVSSPDFAQHRLVGAWPTLLDGWAESQAVWADLRIRNWSRFDLWLGTLPSSRNDW